MGSRCLAEQQQLSKKISLCLNYVCTLWYVSENNKRKESL